MYLPCYIGVLSREKIVSCGSWGEAINTETFALSLQPCPRSHKTQVSPCIILIISEVLSLPWEPRVRVCEQNFVCWPFHSMPGFLLAFCLSPVDQIPDDFHSQMFHGLLFPAVVLWVGCSQWQAKVPMPLRGSYVAEISLWILKPSTWIQGRFTSLSLL